MNTPSVLITPPLQTTLVTSLCLIIRLTCVQFNTVQLSHSVLIIQSFPEVSESSRRYENKFTSLRKTWQFPDQQTTVSGPNSFSLLNDCQRFRMMIQKQSFCENPFTRVRVLTIDLPSMPAYLYCKNTAYHLTQLHIVSEKSFIMFEEKHTSNLKHQLLYSHRLPHHRIRSVAITG